MKTIIWLWNPWEKYKNTRHNVWFLFLDYFKDKNNISQDFSFQSDLNGEIIKTKDFILFKPSTFMNSSWDAVINLLNKYNINKEDILVVYDDIDIPLWTYRFRQNWSSGWQKGMKSIISYIWENFKRLRIWIWQDKSLNLTDWVLWEFQENEQKIISKIFEEIYLKDNKFFK